MRRVCGLLPLSMLFPRLLRMVSFSLVFGVRLFHMMSFSLVFSVRLLHVMGFGLVPFSAGLFRPMCYVLMFFGPVLFLGARLFAIAMRFNFACWRPRLCAMRLNLVFLSTRRFAMRFDPVLFGARLFHARRLGLLFYRARLHAMLFGDRAFFITRMI